MATQTITIPNGTNPRDRLKALAKVFIRLAETVPDTVTGGATVLTVDNSPANGLVTVQVTSGPHSGGSKPVRI